MRVSVSFLARAYNGRIECRRQPSRSRMGGASYYGTIIGGVALGTMMAVTAGAVPVAPAENLCWFWVDSVQVNGYWDYCVAP